MEKGERKERHLNFIRKRRVRKRKGAGRAKGGKSRDTSSIILTGQDPRSKMFLGAGRREGDAPWSPHSRKEGKI